MKSSKKILGVIIISAVLVLAAGSAIIEIADLPHQKAQDDSIVSDQDDKQTGKISTNIFDGEYIFLKILVSLINIGLIIPLFAIYAGIYRKIRSSFTLGLLAVISALGVYAVTSNPMIVTLLGGIPGYIGILQIISDLCATVALIILIRISLE